MNVDLENEKKKNIRLAIAVASFYPSENKIYFFDEGLNRIFDLKRWEEFKSPEIGSTPKGAVGTDGLWVLSIMNSISSVRKIINSYGTDMTGRGGTSLKYSRMVEHTKQLHLIRKYY